MRIPFLLALSALGGGALDTPSAAQQADPHIYRAVFIRAAPGRLLDLIDHLKIRREVYRALGEPEPLLARHSQGDHWDLLLLEPVGSLPDFYAPERQARCDRAAVEAGITTEEWSRRAELMVAWREELFVAGPPLAEFQERNRDVGFYHLEVFLGLAGKRDSLLNQRRMENQYLAAIGRPLNLIFTRQAGAAWDLFTLGFYRDLQHYAEPTAVSVEKQDAAAISAGFESRNHIGSYLRRFLSAHHDTLLSRVP
ncbi:MAG: hypothetical protein E4G90_01690 [Gemmatimonadales bacterium]|nr:MAG: hypothetical protein E4G90_01690 [Gemmatimonadales bacterium]